jgi:hypothetical protein
MESEKKRELNTSKKEIETAWELLSLLEHFSVLLWDHYEISFMEKFNEKHTPPSETFSIEFPF